MGKIVPVFVYTDGDSAELFLNGKSLGRRTKGVVFPRPPNLAAGKPTTTSLGAEASAAVDGDDATTWSAADPGGAPWLQVDLGSAHPVRFIDLALGVATTDAGYAIRTSPDGSNWSTVVAVEPPATGRGRRFGGFGGRRNTHAIYDLADNPANGRYVRIEFNGLGEGTAASIDELKVYSARCEPEYYDVTYQYRLRWNEVVYEPGELKVIAYKQGAKIGEALMRTAGPPASLRLAPDRTDLSATGQDLSYILVEAVDAQGNPAPLADNLIEFEVSGAGELAAVANGDQLSLESFQANRHALFNGKAMLIVRTREDQAGSIQVTAHSSGLEPATVSMKVSP